MYGKREVPRKGGGWERKRERMGEAFEKNGGSQMEREKEIKKVEDQQENKQIFIYGVSRGCS